MGDVDNGRARDCVGAEGRWEISVPSSQFFCEPKTAQKYFFNEKNYIYILNQKQIIWVLPIIF